MLTQWVSWPRGKTPLVPWMSFCLDSWTSWRRARWSDPRSWSGTPWSCSQWCPGRSWTRPSDSEYCSSRSTAYPGTPGTACRPRPRPRCETWKKIKISWNFSIQLMHQHHAALHFYFLFLTLQGPFVRKLGNQISSEGLPREGAWVRV